MLYMLFYIWLKLYILIGCNCLVNLLFCFIVRYVSSCNRSIVIIGVFEGFVDGKFCVLVYWR